MREMRAELPPGWQVDMMDHNSNLCCLPQDRARCFFVGTSERLRATPLQRRLLAVGPFTRKAVNLLHVLDLQPAPDDWQLLTLRQQVNLSEQLKQYHASATDASTVAIVDVARDPLKQMDTRFKEGGTRTLRTNCSHLWIMPSTKYMSTFGDRGRFLSRAEKCRVAGIVPNSTVDLADFDLDVAVGNTIPIPLVGHIMYPVVRAWLLSL